MIGELNGLDRLPHGWIRTQLGEIAEVILGQSPPSSTYNENRRGLPFYQGKLEFGKSYPTPRKWCTIPKKIAEKGDVLISVRAPVGPTNVCPERSCIGRGLAAIRGLGGIETLFVLYLLRAFENEIVRRGTGTTFSAIGGDKLKGLEILLPPFNEQVRIVAKLEELFARLDAGVEGLRKVKAQLKRYRQAVLKYAFEGKLTEKWRKSHRDLIEPASQLVDSIIKAKNSRQDQENHLLKKEYKQPLLPGISTQAGLPEYWAWVTADQLFWSITSGSRGWAKYYSEEGAFFIRVGDLSHDNISIDLKSAQHVNPPDGAELRRTRVSSGDILISITADIGRIALVPIGIKEAYINQHVALAKSVSLFSHSYVAWFLLSPIGQKQLTGLQYGATKAGLGLDNIRRVNIPLAPLVEQHEIVEEIERRLSVLAEAEKVMEQNLKRANSLRQSILRTAFEGRLVPQDLEDEPSDKLLERIREERAKSMDGENTNKRRKNKPRQLELSIYVK